MKFTIRDDYACSAAHFWGEMFFDPEYNRRVYREGLEFEIFELLEQTEQDGIIERKIRVMPKLDAPRPIRKLIGDALTYEEHGRFDGVRWESRVVPSRLADRVKPQLIQWVEPAGDDRCVRYVAFDIEVRILGLGKLMEKFLERTYRENYTKAAQWTNRVWLG